MWKYISLLKYVLKPGTSQTQKEYLYKKYKLSEKYFDTSVQYQWRKENKLSEKLTGQLQRAKRQRIPGFCCVAKLLPYYLNLVCTLYKSSICVTKNDSGPTMETEYLKWIPSDKLLVNHHFETVMLQHSPLAHCLKFQVNGASQRLICKKTVFPTLLSS